MQGGYYTVNRSPAAKYRFGLHVNYTGTTLANHDCLGGFICQAF